MFPIGHNLIEFRKNAYIEQILKGKSLHFIELGVVKNFPEFDWHGVECPKLVKGHKV